MREVPSQPERTVAPWPELEVRAPTMTFDDVPRHWMAGSAAATHLVNGVNLLFPAGERFFVRSVRHYLPQLSHPQASAAVRSFFGQEGRHAQVHERFFDALRAQGYSIDTFLEDYERVCFAGIEAHSPPALRLAVTAALEHFTAIMAEGALTNAALSFAHPAVRQMLEWHALEELEHKAVAFDVLREVNPSYALRVAGMVLGASALAVYWLAGTRRLLAHDGLSLWDAARALPKARAHVRKELGTKIEPIFRRVFLQGMWRYLKPGFHPNDVDHSALVARALERLRAEGIVPPAAAPKEEVAA